MKRIVELGEKFQGYMDVVRSNSHKLSLFLTFGIFCFVVLNVFDGAVNAQFNSSETFEDSQLTEEAIHGDPHGNMGQYGSDKMNATFLTLSKYAYGIDSFDQAARERAIRF